LLLKIIWRMPQQLKEKDFVLQTSGLSSLIT